MNRGTSTWNLTSTMLTEEADEKQQRMRRMLQRNKSARNVAGERMQNSLAVATNTSPLKKQEDEPNDGQEDRIVQKKMLTIINDDDAEKDQDKTSQEKDDRIQKMMQRNQSTRKLKVQQEDRATVPVEEQDKIQKMLQRNQSAASAAVGAC